MQNSDPNISPSIAAHPLILLLLKDCYVQTVGIHRETGGGCGGVRVGMCEGVREGVKGCVCAKRKVVIKASCLAHCEFIRGYRYKCVRTYSVLYIHVHVGTYSPYLKVLIPLCAMATSGAVSYSVPSAGSCGHTPHHYSPAVLTLSEVLGA